MCKPCSIPLSSISLIGLPLLHSAGALAQVQAGRTNAIVGGWQAGGFKAAIPRRSFNLSNTPRFSSLNTAIDTAAGGKVSTTANNPRQLQFALKYNF